MTTKQVAPRPRDKKKRPRLTERQVLEVLINQGAVIPCGICRIALDIKALKHVERDHRRSEYTIPDEDLEKVFADLSLQRYVHGRLDPDHPCHLEKTAGDRRIQAKHDRIKGITKAGPKAKIRSRGFIGHRKFSGEVVYKERG